MSISSRAKNFLVSDVCKIAFSQMSYKAAMFLVFLVLSVNFSKVYYASFVFIISIILMVNEILVVGLTQGITRYAASTEKRASDVDGLALVLFFFSLLIFFLSGVAFLILWRFEWIGVSLMDVILMALYVFSFSLYSSLNAYFNGYQQYGPYLAAHMVAGWGLFIFVSFYVFLFGASVTVSNILLIYVVSVSMAVLSQIFSIKRSAFKYCRGVGSSVWGFGKWYIIWAVAWVVESKYEVFYLAYLGLQESLAELDVALKFLMVVQVFLTVLVTFFNPRYASASPNARFEIHEKITFYIRLIVGWGVFSCVFVGLFIHHYYNGVYDKSILLYVILLAGLLFTVCTYPFSVVIYALNKPRYLAYIGVSSCVFKVVLVSLFLPMFGVWGAALSAFLVNIYIYIVTCWISKKL